MQNFIESLVNYCAKSTMGRDESHGVDHMSKVRENSIEIFNQESQDIPENDQKQKLLKMIIAVSQFHDIADHKYVKDFNSLNMKEELCKYFSPEDSDLILKIIELISYSKEKKYRQQNNCSDCQWIDQLGQDGQFIRDIVSDADKLEAIGKIGVERCIEYKKKILKDNNQQLDNQDILEDLVIHAKEKLFILLKQKYIRTKTGRELAKPRHQEMLDIICSMLNDQGQQERAKQLYDEYTINNIE